MYNCNLKWCTKIESILDFYFFLWLINNREFAFHTFLLLENKWFQADFFSNREINCAKSAAKVRNTFATWFLGKIYLGHHYSISWPKKLRDWSCAPQLWLSRLVVHIMKMKVDWKVGRYFGLGLVFQNMFILCPSQLSKKQARWNKRAGGKFAKPWITIMKVFLFKTPFHYLKRFISLTKIHLFL